MVLGLTMAEVMLLLVFCLLIAAAVIFKHDRQLRDELENSLAMNELELERSQAEQAALEHALRASERARNRAEEEMERLTELLQTARGSSADIRDDWRELVAADVLVQQLRKAGLTPEAIVDQAPEVKELMALVEDGTTTEDVASALSLQEEMSEQLSANGLSELSPERIAKLAAMGKEAELAARGEGEHDWPPIIRLSEASGYSFSVGRAELTSDFETALRTTIAAQVLDYIDRYGASVVEVIGHTDEQPITPRPSNLDAELIPVLTGARDINVLIPGDNAGLGMARAVSVAGVLRADPRFSSVTVLPLSAGQLIVPGDALADGTSPGDAQQRRRIEIRVRRPEAPSNAAEH